MHNDMEWAVHPSIWNVEDHQGAVPVPRFWESNQEWFNEDGRAKRIPGPRFYGPDGKSWHWGPTEWVRELGEYTILCCRDDRSTFSSWRDQTDHGQLLYTAWVGDKPLDTMWESLDAVLVDVVRFKNEGRRESSGPRATEYFLKMVGWQGAK